MGCASSSDPLLADIYDSFEQKYDFEQILPSDTKITTSASSSSSSSLSSNGTSSESQLLNNKTLHVTDQEIDINNNSANLSASSDPLDVIIDLNDKTSKLIIRLIQYNGNELQPIIKLGMNESKHSPLRQVYKTEDNNNRQSEEEQDYIMKGNNRGLFNIERIITSFIRDSGVDVHILCPQRFFPNDIKSMIISFYSFEHPKLSSFRVIIPTAFLCSCILNLCNYIGHMLSEKLLFQDKVKEIDNINRINQQLIISEDNASICRQLIFLFHYILCLDQYKMPKQQPLTNNFTAYKRMHSEFTNKQNYRGGGFASFKNKDANNNNDELTKHNLTDKELLPIDQLTNIAMFMGRGSTGCIDCICENLKFENETVALQILSEFANGCLTLLRANGNNKQNRNMKIVKYALYVLRAMVAILLILDTKKSEQNAFNSVFGSNENRVKNVACMRMVTTQFIQYYGDDLSIQTMQGVDDKNDVEYHIKYCKRIIKFGAKGFKNDAVKRSIENMFD